MTKPRTSLPSYPLPADADIKAAPPGKAFWPLSADEAREYYKRVIQPAQQDGKMRRVAHFTITGLTAPEGYLHIPKADAPEHDHWLPCNSPNEGGAALMDWLVNGKPPCDNLVDTHCETLPPPADSTKIEQKSVGNAPMSSTPNTAHCPPIRRTTGDFIDACEATKSQAKLTMEVVLAALRWQEDKNLAPHLILALNKWRMGNLDNLLNKLREETLNTAESGKVK